MKPRGVRRAITASLAALAVAAGTLFATAFVTAPAYAADLSAFDPGLIITDDLFFDGDAMTTDSVQSFLKSKAPTCISGGGYTCIADYKASTNKRDSNANCSAVAAKTGQTAASIITLVARACNISPKVIVVTLQKEQGLITAGPKSSSAYRIAMGYGCPDTAACDKKYYGFFNQVYSAAWQFQQYAHSSSFNFEPGRVNTIRYHPNASCGSVSVYIRNQATAGLYNYTPYVPNSAALAAGYGMGNSCSTYGNRNFFNYYSDWFGNPANGLKNASFQDKTEHWKSGSNGGVTYTAGTSAANAQSGSRYVNVSTTVAGRRFEQTISKNPSTGQVWEGGIWVRAGETGATVNGAVVITATGGTAESVSIPFVVGDAWTEVSGQLAIEKTGHSGMRLSVQLDTVDTTYRIDTTALYVTAKQEPRSPLTVEQSGIDSGKNGGWVRTTKTGVTLKSGYAAGPVDGKYYLKASSTTAGRNVYQRIARKTVVGTAYTATAWVRSGKSGQDYTGRFVLKGVGGSEESTTTDFTVGDEWTQVSATLDVDKPDHASVRIYFYLDTPGIELLFDKITLAPDLLARDPSFEVGTAGLNALPAGTTATSVKSSDFAAHSLTGAPMDGRSVLLLTSTTASTSYARMDRNRVLSVGGSYTASMWVRAAQPDAELAVRLRLTAQDGLVSENTEQAFTVTDEWQLITVTHVIVKSSLTRLRTDLMLDTGNASLIVDGAAIR
jgi:hypothetical protein